MQVRIIHMTNETPYVSREVLIDYFGVTNPAVKTIEHLGIQNALPLIENIGWVVDKVIERDNMISVLFIKQEENE